MGAQVMSLFLDLVQTTTKIYRTSSYVSFFSQVELGELLSFSSQPVILRCAALVTLRKGILVGGKSMSDQTIKDALKAIRGGLTDKAGAVVRESAEVCTHPSAVRT